MATFTKTTCINTLTFATFGMMYNIDCIFKYN